MPHVQNAIILNGLSDRAFSFALKNPAISDFSETLIFHMSYIAGFYYYNVLIITDISAGSFLQLRLQKVPH